MSAAGFRRFNLLTLAFTLAVILWGAYVRASGAGAGCGSHWPTCNGEIIPRPHSVATIIELTHRTTSGLAFLLVAAQLVLALRIFPRGHGARRAAAAAMAFMVSEALIGAGLVLFKMVARNESVARAAWVSAHLLNTFALLAALALAGWRAAGGQPSRERLAPAGSLALLLGMAGTLVVAVSGAIAALGDTLFPVRSFAEGWRQDLSPTAHLFVRLRILHPLLAVSTGALLLLAAGGILVRDRPAGARPGATALAALVLAQLAAGLLNLALLAPVPLQMVHLLLADLVWILLVRLAAATRPFPVTAAALVSRPGQPSPAPAPRG